jgi:hypothetical protein
VAGSPVFSWVYTHDCLMPGAVHGMNILAIYYLAPAAATLARVAVGRLS